MFGRSGFRDVALLVSSLILLALTGCATATTVAPTSAQPAEKPAPVDTSFQLPASLGPIYSPGEVRELVPGGAIEWGGKVVWARGAGVVDPGNSDRAVAWQMAARAATVVAQRNLLEIVKGVKVDSDTRIQDLVAANDTIFRRIEGMIRNAREHGPARYDSAGGTVEVQVECDLYGENGVEGAALPPPAVGPQLEQSGPTPSPAALEFLRQYSGLLLDAGNTGLRPALFPKVYDDNGILLLDPRAFARAGVGEAYTVQYVGTYDQLLGRPDVGQPLMIRVREARGKFGTDAVLARPDAGVLRAGEDALEFLLNAGRIVIRLAQ